MGYKSFLSLYESINQTQNLTTKLKLNFHYQDFIINMEKRNLAYEQYRIALVLCAEKKNLPIEAILDQLAQLQSLHSTGTKASVKPKGDAEVKPEPTSSDEEKHAHVTELFDRPEAKGKGQ